MMEPKYRQSKKKARDDLMRPRAGTNLGGKGKSTEMEGKLNGSILVTPKSVAEDTVKALEWIMANMSKSVESAQKSRSKGEEKIGGKFQLHSGELMVNSKENEEEDEGQNGGKTLVPKKHPSKGGGNRAMAVNSYRMAKKNEQQDGNGNGGNVRMRHRERLIKVSNWGLGNK